MREVDLDNLTSKDLIDHAAISGEFKKYLMEVLEYDEDEADFVVSTDFENPYDTPFIMQEYVGEYTVDGKVYEVRSCRTDFCACGLWHLTELPPFEFYMFFDLETLPDTTVGTYQNARKMYLINNKQEKAVLENDNAEQSEDILSADKEIEARIAELMASAEDDDSEVVEYMEEQEDNYSGDIADFAFREAIRQGIISYIENHAEDFDLNDEGGYSSYLYETDDPDVQDVLMEYGAFRSWEDYSDCRFATETVNGTILAFDEDFQKEVFQKYLETYGISVDDVISMFDDEEAAESFEDEHDRCFSDDLEAMGITVEDDEISFEDKVDSDGWELRELIEELGWTCSFEGDSWKFETNGVYFIH